MSGKPIPSAAPAVTDPVVVATGSILENPVPQPKRTVGDFFKSCCSCIWGATTDLRDVMLAAGKEAAADFLEEEVRERLGDKLSDAQLRAISATGKRALNSIVDSTAKKLDALAETHGSAEHIKSGAALSGMVVTAATLVIPGADTVVEMAKPSLKKPIITDKAIKDLYVKMKASGGKIDLTQLNEVEVLAHKQIMDAVTASIDASPDLTPRQKSSLKSTGAMSVLIMEFINNQNKIIATKKSTVPSVADSVAGSAESDHHDDGAGVGGGAIGSASDVGIELVVAGASAASAASAADDAQG